MTPTSPSSAKPSPRCFLNPRSLAGRRIARYLAEPFKLDNTLVGLADVAPDVATLEAAHEKRVAEELSKLENRLP